jgi:hypothetical protein
MVFAHRGLALLFVVVVPSAITNTLCLTSHPFVEIVDSGHSEQSEQIILCVSVRAGWGEILLCHVIAPYVWISPSGEHPT